MLSDKMATRRLTRQEKQQITRRAILKSAETLFARKGVEGTSVEEIAQHAGLTQGAIYSNFRSKSDLWSAIADEITNTINAEDLITGDRDLKDELHDAGVAAAQLLREVPRTSLLLNQEFNMFQMRHPRAREKYAREIDDARDAAADLFKRVARKRGRKLPRRPEVMARMLEVVAAGLIQQLALDPDSVDEDLCVALFESLAD